MRGRENQKGFFVSFVENKKKKSIFLGKAKGNNKKEKVQRKEKGNLKDILKKISKKKNLKGEKKKGNSSPATEDLLSKSFLAPLQQREKKKKKKKKKKFLQRLARSFFCFSPAFASLPSFSFSFPPSLHLFT